MSDLTHFDEHGASRMVDTSAKPETLREARATGLVRMAPATLALIRDRAMPRATCSRSPAWPASWPPSAPATSSPCATRCRSLPPRSTSPSRATTLLRIEATVRVLGRTGVEMEALTAVSVAALTVYDMCKAVDRVMTIERIRLEEKSGGSAAPSAATIDAPRRRR